MGKNQEEPEAVVLWENHDVVAITEMWWDDCHGWHGAMDGCKLLRRDMPGGRGGGVTFSVREYFSCVELKNNGDKAECL